MPSMDLHLTDWAAIAQIVLAVTALLALVGAAIQIKVARSASREALTYNYTQRFATPELLPFHERTDKLFRLDGVSAKKSYKRFQRWDYEDKLAALLVPNLFEELAGMYNQGLLHKGITKDFFGATALDVWKRGYWFIDLSRKSNPKYYEQWQLMLEAMNLLPKAASSKSAPG